MRLIQHSAVVRLAVAPTLVTLLCLPVARAAGVGQSQGLSFEQLESGGTWQTGGTGWSGAIGLGVAAVPRYPGASSDRARVIPLLSLSYRGTVFLSPFGLVVKALQVDGFFAGPVLGFEGSRDETDDPHLAGLGDIPASITGGLIAGYRVGRWQALVTARQALTHSGNGLEGLAELDYRAILIPRQVLMTVGPEITFVDAEHAKTWFGVTEGQAASSGLPVFTPSAGVDAVGAHAILTSVLGRHTLLRVFGAFRRFTGAVADSPIVQKSTYGIIGAGIAYRF